MYSPGGPTTNILTQAVINGDAYRVSARRTLSDGEEFIIHLDPVDTGGTIYLEAPAVQTEIRALYDVYENADPGTNLVDDLEVHNMRYDGDETPEATVQRVSNGGLDISSADKTEETFADSTNEGVDTGSAETRAIYRVIPTTDIISLVITDDSGGTNNNFAIDLVVYEGDTLPE